MFKKIVILLIITVSCLASCDGKQVYHNSSKKQANQYKLNHHFEQLIFHPEQAAEIQVDTTMSQGYQIKLISKTFDKDSLQNTYTESVTTHKHIYRSFKTEVSIKKDENTLFSKSIDFDYLSLLNYKFEIFRNKFIISNVEVNQSKTIANNAVVLNILLSDPINKKFKVYDLYIDHNGKEKIKEVNT